MAPRYALRKVFHGTRVRRAGAGSMPLSSGTRLMVLRPSSWPRLRNARRIRVYPQLGFSEANLTTSCCTPAALAGRPAAQPAETVVLLGDELAVAAQEGLWGHEAGEPRQTLRAANGRPFGRQPAALLIGEPQPPATELLAQHPVLLLEVVNRLELAPMHPPGEEHQQETQRLRPHRLAIIACPSDRRGRPIAGSTSEEAFGFDADEFWHQTPSMRQPACDTSATGTSEGAGETDVAPSTAHRAREARAGCACRRVPC